VTLCAGSRVTSKPLAISHRPQWWALPQASISTRQGVRFSQKRSNCERESRRRSVIFPRSSATTTWKTVLARSTATVTLLFMVDSFRAAGKLIGVNSPQGWSQHGRSPSRHCTHARERHQVLLTFDRDFGELIYRQAAPAPAGVVHFRFIPTTPEEPAVVLRQLLAVKGLDLIGRYTVVERDRVRQRPLLRSR
jgi:hypothetical protein